MEKDNVSIEKESESKVVPQIAKGRIKALIVDGAICLLTALILNLINSSLVGTYEKNYKSNYDLLILNIEKSGLSSSDSGAIYTTKELTDNKCELFINTMKTFYIDFMSSNHNENDENTYNINYINEKILKINEENYFVFKEELGTPKTDEIGIVNESLLTEKEGQFVVAENSNLWDFVYNAYMNAITQFNNLDVNIKASDILTLINSLIKSLAYIVSLLLFFAVVPSLFGETIGKKIFKLKTINYNGEKPSFWMLLLRSLPSALCLGLYCFIPDATIASSVFFICVAVGIGFIIFTKSHRAIHDFLTRTQVVSIEENKNLKENESI